jgi:integrator complex subunit 9
MQMEVHGLSTTPLFFLSPVADSSLAYANIMAEWLSTAKQSKVYIPEEPFIHGHLARSGRLKSFRSLHDENFSNDYRQVIQSVK